MKNQIDVSTRVVSLIIALILICSNQVYGGAFKDDYAQTYDFYQAAIEKKDNNLIRQAAEKFHVLTLREDAGSLGSNAQYWESQSWFAVKEYAKALQGFERVLLDKGSNKEEAARFKVVHCYIRLKWQKEADWELKRFAKDYPQSKLLGTLRAEIKSLKP